MDGDAFDLIAGEKIATKLGCSKDLVREMLKNGTLPKMKVGKGFGTYRGAVELYQKTQKPVTKEQVLATYSGGDSKVSDELQKSKTAREIAENNRAIRLADHDCKKMDEFDAKVAEFNEEIAERENAIAPAEKQIAEKAEKVSRWQASIAEREAAVEQRESVCDKRDKDLDAREVSIQSGEAKATQKTASAKKLEEQVEKARRLFKSNTGSIMDEIALADEFITQAAHRTQDKELQNLANWLFDCRGRIRDLSKGVSV